MPWPCTVGGHNVAMSATEILEGFHDVSGTWRPATDGAVQRIRRSLGEAPQQPPLWFVCQGSSDRFWSPCRIVLEHGEDLGVLEQLPRDLPIGYHELAPVDAGPVTRLVVHPPWCPPLPRVWGVAVQVYALWDRHSWGIGDLGTVRRLAERVKAAGGSALLLSPLHQPAPGAPQADSPYWPSSRRTRNPLLLAIDAPPPPDLVCTSDALIDRDRVWLHKRARLWEEFRRTGGPRREPSTVAWWNARRERYGPEVATWPGHDAHDDLLCTEARFHEWLDERIDEQLAAVTGTGALLIGDLAVGFAPDGADATEFSELLVHDMRIGAPPDEFNAEGQEWGLPPFHPARLRAARYEPFIATVRATLRGMSGLRIDHVMGLFRQYWVPAGSAPSDGAYVRFPADELLAIIAIEATRAGAFVIGEDLGTVDDDVRTAMARWGIGGTRVLWFEDAPPSDWPQNCLATVTTHDLPTVAGVIELDATDPRRRRLDAVTGGATDVHEAARGAHRALLGSPAAVRLLAVDDLTGAREQANVPGSVGPPNWCRRLPLPVDAIDVGMQTNESLIDG